MNIKLIMNIEQQDRDHDQHQHKHQQAWNQVSALNCHKEHWIWAFPIGITGLKRWFREVVNQFLTPAHQSTSWTSGIATQIYRFIEMGSQLKGFSRCAVRSFISSFWEAPGLWGDWRVGFWSRVGVIQGPPPQYFCFMTWGGGQRFYDQGSKICGIERDWL